jgi:tagatose 6-phosphate kinase
VIVTITLNAALDVSYQTPNLTWETTNQITRVRHQAGGRGVAVARVLHTFGHEVVAAGFAGGETGELIREDLAQGGIPTAFTKIGKESRRVTEVHDQATGRRLRFTEPPPYITTEELGRFAADYRHLLADATAVVLCGSLPAGMPPEIYGTLATYATEAGIPTILDAGGHPLHYGAARRPALVIPDETPADPNTLLTAGVGAIALLTNHKVHIITPQSQWQAHIPATPTTHPWPRDALVAGLVPGVLLNWSWPDRLRHAVALAASTTSSGEIDLPTYEHLVGEVRISHPA